MSRRALFIISAGALIALVSMGTRQSFGIFLQPITASLGAGRELFSLAIALQSIVFGLPFLSMVADQVGPRWVLFGGGLLYAAGLLLLASIATPTGLLLSLGLIMGLALSSVSYGIVLGGVAQVVSAQRRSTVFGLITAAGSFGMFALVPLAQWLLATYGWRNAFTLLGIPALLIVLFALGFPSRAGTEPNRGSHGEPVPGTLFEAMAVARRHSGYLLLNMGFFVCGFHVAFISTHLPAFLTDNGISPATGATALSLIGLFNIFGSYLFGALGDRYRKKFLLSILYFSRAIVIALFLLIPLSNGSALAFGAAIGFLWLATVPLTSGTVAQIFGSRYLATLYGIVFFSHQVGSFLGVWLGGRLYDATGSYDGVWIAAIVLGVVAAVIHLPIKDGSLQPVRVRATTAPAADT